LSSTPIVVGVSAALVDAQDSKIPPSTSAKRAAAGLHWEGGTLDRSCPDTAFAPFCTYTQRTARGEPENRPKVYKKNIASATILRGKPAAPGGYIWIMHASLCRTDTITVQAEDVAYVPSAVQTRAYDPVGNLRNGNDQTTYGPANSQQKPGR
jgi:hypothetical protein